MNDLGRTEVAQNIEFRIQSCPWYRNKPESLSQILLHLYAYCGMMIADRCMVGNGTVTYHNEELATFTIDKDLNIPVFEFAEKYKDNNWPQEIYLWYVRKEKENGTT